MDLSDHRLSQSFAKSELRVLVGTSSLRQESNESESSEDTWIIASPCILEWLLPCLRGVVTKEKFVWNSNLFRKVRVFSIHSLSNTQCWWFPDDNLLWFYRRHSPRAWQVAPQAMTLSAKLWWWAESNQFYSKCFFSVLDRENRSRLPVIIEVDQGTDFLQNVALISIKSIFVISFCRTPQSIYKIQIEAAFRWIYESNLRIIRRVIQFYPS